MQSSSQKVGEFLKQHNLSTKEFAGLIGVTQAYVYKLVDEKVPFTNKQETIERIAVIMQIKPTEFEEYQKPHKNEIYESYDNSATRKFLDIRENYTISNLDYILKAPPSLRLRVVDILREAKEIPPDITFIEMLLMNISGYLIKDIDVRMILEAAFVSAMKSAGTIFDYKNTHMLRQMLDNFVRGN